MITEDIVIKKIEDLCQTWQKKQVAKNHKTFEDFVATELTKAFSRDVKLEGKVDTKHLKGKKFPDIKVTIKNEACDLPEEQLGIEVKTTKGKTKAAKILGGSIMEGTANVPFEKIYVVFGNLKTKNYIFKKYKESIRTIKITHSPRYFLDLKLKIGQDFFSRNNIKYLDPAGQTHKEIFSYYKSLIIADMKKNTEDVWWCEKGTPAIDELVINLRELPKYESDFVICSLIKKYPSLLTETKDEEKYIDPSKWLLRRHSIICHNLRDNFSSGSAKKNKAIKETLKYLEIDSKGLPNFIFIFLRLIPTLMGTENINKFFQSEDDLNSWKDLVLKAQLDNPKGNQTKLALAKIFSCPHDDLIKKITEKPKRIKQTRPKPC